MRFRRLKDRQTRWAMPHVQSVARGFQLGVGWAHNVGRTKWTPCICAFAEIALCHLHPPRDRTFAANAARGQK